MINMDNRLDFLNYLNEYTETLTEDDSLFLVSFNKKQGDSFLVNKGWEAISALLSIKEVTDESDAFLEARAVVLNIAINICLEDSEIKKQVLSALK